MEARATGARAEAAAAAGAASRGRVGTLGSEPGARPSAVERALPRPAPPRPAPRPPRSGPRGRLGRASSLPAPGKRVWARRRPRRRDDPAHGRDALRRPRRGRGRAGSVVYTHVPRPCPLRALKRSSPALPPAPPFSPRAPLVRAAIPAPVGGWAPQRAEEVAGRARRAGPACAPSTAPVPPRKRPNPLAPAPCTTAYSDIPVRPAVCEPRYHSLCARLPPSCP